jgi:renalase
VSVGIVGAGIAGAACAAALRAGGVEVEIVERGRAPGGRLASPELHGRRVDLGAAYFTVADARFGDAVAGWAAAGVAREWTDTLDAVDGQDPARPPDRRAKPGPVRWAAPGGLRTLARSILGAAGVRPTYECEISRVDDVGHDAVVLAMPDPQAARLLGDDGDGSDRVGWVDYEPVISVVAGWSRRHWPHVDAIFVNGDPDLTLIADDGARRGDGAPVLVAHSSVPRAHRHLEAPEDAVPAVLAATRRVLDIDAEPAWTHVHRWTFAKPSGTHGDAPFGLVRRDGRTVGICGDSWCPSGAPRVESAWLSGTRLGEQLATRLNG